MISTSSLDCELLFRKFHQSCRAGKERFRNKDYYKTPKIKSPLRFLELSVEWRKQEVHNWAVLSNNERKNIAHTECFENATDDLFTWMKECVAINIKILSIISKI